MSGGAGYNYVRKMAIEAAKAQLAKLQVGTAATTAQNCCQPASISPDGTTATYADGTSQTVSPQGLPGSFNVICQGLNTYPEPQQFMLDGGTTGMVLLRSEFFQSQSPTQPFINEIPDNSLPFIVQPFNQNRAYVLDFDLLGLSQYSGKNYTDTSNQTVTSPFDVAEVLTNTFTDINGTTQFYFHKDFPAGIGTISGFNARFTPDGKHIIFYYSVLGQDFIYSANVASGSTGNPQVTISSVGYGPSGFEIRWGVMKNFGLSSQIFNNPNVEMTTYYQLSYSELITGSYLVTLDLLNSISPAPDLPTALNSADPIPGFGELILEPTGLEFTGFGPDDLVVMKNYSVGLDICCFSDNSNPDFDLLFSVSISQTAQGYVRKFLPGVVQIGSFEGFVDQPCLVGSGGLFLNQSQYSYNFFVSNVLNGAEVRSGPSYFVDSIESLVIQNITNVVVQDVLLLTGSVIGQTTENSSNIQGSSYQLSPFGQNFVGSVSQTGLDFEGPVPLPLQPGMFLSPTGPFPNIVSISGYTKLVTFQNNVRTETTFCTLQFALNPTSTSTSVYSSFLIGTSELPYIATSVLSTNPVTASVLDIALTSSNFSNIIQFASPVLCIAGQSVQNSLASPLLGSVQVSKSTVQSNSRFIDLNFNPGPTNVPGQEPQLLVNIDGTLTIQSITYNGIIPDSPTLIQQDGVMTYISTKKSQSFTGVDNGGNFTGIFLVSLLESGTFFESLFLYQTTSTLFRNYDIIDYCIK